MTDVARSALGRLTARIRPRSDKSAAGREIPVVLRRVDDAESADRAYDLWSRYIGESSPDPVQLDRWGPGLPVLVDADGRPVDPTDLETRGQVAADMTARLGDQPAEGVADFELTPDEPGSAVRTAVQVLAGTPRDCGAALAEVDRTAVGLVAWSIQRHPFLAGESGAVDVLYVDPGFRHGGVGTRLVDWATESLRREGIHSVAVEVPQQNRGARAFFRRVGYPAFGTVGYHYD